MHPPNENSCVYGRRAVTELLQSGTPVDTVFIADSLDAKDAGYFTALAKNAGAIVKHTRTEKLNTLCDGNKHQGVAAFAAAIPYSSLEDILKTAQDREEPPFLLLADGIEDPHNLGALLRTALLCDVHGAVIPKRNAVGLTPAVLKASAGAATRLPVARVTNMADTVRRLKEQNVFVYGADMGGTPFYKVDLTGPVALVMGNEHKGISSLVKKLCDETISLPIHTVGGVDSLNVSVAGGILLYDVFRHRVSPKTDPV